MRKAISVFAAGLLLSSCLLGVSSSKKHSTKKTSSKKKSSHRASSKKSSSTKRAEAKRPSQRRQMQPMPDRYREIQEALVKKGYLKEEPSGQWDQHSIEALRRFQQDQNLDGNGKLDSLSLIALGLGPKHEMSAAVQPPTPERPQP